MELFDTAAEVLSHSMVIVYFTRCQKTTLENDRENQIRPARTLVAIKISQPLLTIAICFISYENLRL